MSHWGNAIGSVDWHLGHPYSQTRSKTAQWIQRQLQATPLHPGEGMGRPKEEAGSSVVMTSGSPKGGKPMRGLSQKRLVVTESIPQRLLGPFAATFRDVCTLQPERVQQ